MLVTRRGRHLLSLHHAMPNSAAADPFLTEQLLASPPSGMGDGPMADYVLHDVVDDPLQERDLLGVDPNTATRLHQDMVRWRTGPDAPPGGRLKPEDLWELRMTQAFGYW